MTVKCPAHQDRDAAWEVTMYKRDPSTRLWRTRVCEECLEINKPILKMNGPGFLMILMRVDA